MKSFLAFILISLSSLSFATEFSEAGVHIVETQEMINRWDSNEKEEIKERLNQAYALAIQIVEKTSVENAWTHGYFAENRIFKNLALRLKKTHLKLIPPTSKNRICSSGNVMAFAINYIGAEMNVCPIGLFQSTELMAQIFIHEGAHLIAGGDECKATLIESLAMLQSDIPTALANGYWERCKISDFINKVRKSL